MKNYFLITLLIVMFSCNKSDEPEQVLRSFINLRFQKGSNFESLASKTTGSLYTSLRAMTSEQRVKFDETSQFKKKSLKILNKDCTKKSCKITYIISYEKETEGNPYNAEIRNVAQIDLVDDEWKISSVGGLKTYFESKKSIDP